MPWENVDDEMQAAMNASLNYRIPRDKWATLNVWYSSPEKRVNNCTKFWIIQTFFAVSNMDKISSLNSRWHEVSR